MPMHTYNFFIPNLNAIKERPKMFHKFATIFLCSLAVVRCDFFEGCGSNVDCMEADFIKKIDEYDEKASVDSPGGLLVLKKSPGDDVQSRSAEDFLERVYRFASSHEITLKVPTSFDGARKLIAEVRSSKLKKFVVPFIVLMILKKSIEVPIYLGIVSILAFKGLAAGLISLVLSAATAFKSLLEHHSSSKVSYEVVPQLASPHWSRSGVDYPNFTPSGYHTIEEY